MRREFEAEPAPPAAGEPGRSEAANLEPVIENRLFVLVLQHPQEQIEPRGTAATLVTALRRARLIVGLSWPNIGRALGRPTDPRRWGVLYLGSARLFSATNRPDAERAYGGEIIAIGRDNGPLPGTGPVLRNLEGIVLLDGTWSQAKTLWWRNPWLLKLQRIVLNPPAPARFGQLRREPRREALSTIEAASLVLRHIERDPKPADALVAALDRLIAAQVQEHGGVIGHGVDQPRDHRGRYPRVREPGRSHRYRGRSAAG